MASVNPGSAGCAIVCPANKKSFVQNSRRYSTHEQISATPSQRVIPQSRFRHAITSGTTIEAAQKGAACPLVIKATAQQAMAAGNHMRRCSMRRLDT